ncbi:2Fe-2S iron-sulfur cluster-binding protein [Oceanibium sediminis]|uniref:2Fe-2S iron-sulfur cluster-binding protein n=1 Tax=Oceanibium sediminis TaxID=2026339 RepID=UPI000DD4A382|nr:2Fe-2S iron-sulfur cluster-binding protein [Oceanibium sediminis]
MTKIVFIEPDGTQKTVEALEGASLMLAATMGGVEGIAAECGGNCVCATCHCLVLEGPVESLSEMGEDEKDTLEFSAEKIFENSRLTCQLEACPEMDGLVFKVVGK